MGGMSCHDKIGGAAQAAMSIGGAGPRWPMAAAAGANPYLYGGMGGAVVGGYGDLQQQPAQQQPMLHGGVPYGSMDAMFGVGGQLAPGVTTYLRHLIPACGQKSSSHAENCQAYWSCRGPQLSTPCAWFWPVLLASANVRLRLAERAGSVAGRLGDWVYHHS